MWYYIPDWFKWFKGKPRPDPQEEALSEIIRRRAEEQKAVIDRVAEAEVEKTQEGKVAEKDFFE